MGCVDEGAKTWGVAWLGPGFRCQTRDTGCCMPDMITLAFNVTTMPLSKTAIQPASASWPMEGDEVWELKAKSCLAWQGRNV
jgi:hypothetical protein